ncbi:MAG: hypothetical protein J6K87_01130 [Clostridia bacterium]|nr:hypothetical protein [Clostridia bacterium]
MILRSFGYSGDVEDLNNETKALFEQELGFVAGGINSFSKRLGSCIISLLPFVPSNAFADDLNKPVTPPASKVVDNNDSTKINWQYITNTGKRLAKDINLSDKKTIGALSVNSLVMLALGYGLKSLTTPSGASDDVSKTDQILSFALNVAYKCGLEPPAEDIGTVATFSNVLNDILKRYSTLDKKYILYYAVDADLLLDSEPLTMQQLNEYYSIKIEPDGDYLSFTKGIKVLQERYDLPFDKNFMLTLAQSCQKMFLLGAEKANEFDRLNNEVDRMYAGYDYQFDEIGHTYHPEDYNKKKLKDKMNVNSRRKKEHKTAKTFERFMRKVAEKSRKKFEDNSYVEISELIDCIDDSKTKKLFSDNSNDFMEKSRRKKDNIEFDYEDIYSGELPENENYLDIDDDLENPVTETQDDEIITSDTVLSGDEEPVKLPDNPRDDAIIKLHPTRTKQRQTEIKNLKSKQKKSAWYIQKQYEPKETTYDITPKTVKIRKTKNNPTTNTGKIRKTKNNPTTNTGRSRNSRK